MKEVTCEKIVEIVQRHIGNEETSFDQYNKNLQDLGMDSLMFIQIVVALEAEFDCEILDSKLLLTEMDTINKMYLVLTKYAVEVSKLD